MTRGSSRRGEAVVWTAAWLLATLAAPAVLARDAPCDIVLSTTQVDYGRLSRVTMPVDASGMLELPLRTVGMHIRCPDPRDMAVVFRATPSGADGFRFTDGGRFALQLRDGRLDGVPVELGRVDDEAGVPTRIGTSLAWAPEKRLAPLKNGQVTVGREFSATIDIAARIEDQALTVGDATRWTTAGTIELATSAVSRELTLRADVQPGRCNVQVARHIAFRRLRSTDLDDRGASTRVPATRSGRLQVVCDGPMPLALRVLRDERAGTAVAPVGLDASYPNAQLFGLGKTPAGQNIGAYVLQWNEIATTDRGELHATRSVDGGRTWAPAHGAFMASHGGMERVGYATVEGATTGPLGAKTLDVTLDATIFVAPKASLSLDEEVRADGLVTFEIVY